MNKYRLVQLGCLLSVVMALLLHTAIPDHAIPAAFCVEVILRLLQLVLIPNVFLSLCSAIILLDTQLIKKLLLGFLRMVVSLWMLVVSLLFAFWVFI